MLIEKEEGSAVIKMNVELKREPINNSRSSEGSEPQNSKIKREKGDSDESSQSLGDEKPKRNASSTTRVTRSTGRRRAEQGLHLNNYDKKQTQKLNNRKEVKRKVNKIYDAILGW